MLPIIIVSIIAVAFAIGAYQLIIHKYYWGPGGPPKQDKKAPRGREKT